MLKLLYTCGANFKYGSMDFDNCMKKCKSLSKGEDFENAKNIYISNGQCLKATFDCQAKCSSINDNGNCWEKSR